MHIIPADHGSTRVLALDGRLDATTCNQFEEVCRQELQSAATSILVDLSTLEYMSSAGLRAILSMEKLSRHLGKPLLFCAMQPMVADLFRVSGFDRILRTFSTQEDALTTLEAQ